MKTMCIVKCIAVVGIVIFMLTSICSAGVIYDKLTKRNRTENRASDMANEDLGPPDHLDAVKFERDGHMNDEFHHEIFLGEEIRHFQQETRADQIAKLSDIFQRADADQNEKVDEDELEAWVMKNVNEHMQQAMKESEDKFAFVGGDNDKGVTYELFNAAFMENMRKKNASHNGKFTEEYITERLTLVKKEWQEADLNNDTILSKKEFLFFQHPEMSERTLTQAVSDFLDERDFNMDQMLELKEFVFGFPLGEMDIEDYTDGDELLKDKVFQFKKLVDTDGNSFADKTELRAYLDPFSKINARNDAHDMVFFVDMDNDMQLSFEEMMMASEYLTGTKLYDASSYFHSEL